MSDAAASFPDDIVFLDNDLAVVIKRVGEICQDNSPQSLSQRMRPAIESALGHGVECCQCVHRLDQPVSGLCILALTERSLSAVSESFARGAVQKTYCAVTERTSRTGPESEEWRQLDCLMVFDPRLRRARIVGPGYKGAKKARLRYQVAGQGERYDFLLVESLTGRSHQIRCQLAADGRPIKGDVKYGARRPERGGGIRLHAYKLELTHPVIGERLVFTCRPPQMDALWRACTEALCRFCPGAH